MFKSYEELDSHLSVLYSNGKYAEAVEILENALPFFPDNFASANLDLAIMYIQLENIQKSADCIKNALDRGIWYPKPFFEAQLDTEEFKELLPTWDELEQAAKKNAKPEWQIFLPKDYDPAKDYPLFIAIHGWGEDIKLFSKFWHSPVINERYIMAMPQSSQMVGSLNFCWNDREKTHQEIAQLYEHIKKLHRIDTGNIITGGFSQGATVALDMALNFDYVPLKGVISLNPSKPEFFDEIAIVKAVRKGIRFCIVTGDKDGDYPAQQEMKKEFDKYGDLCSIAVRENWGHWFPEDLGQRLDDAVYYINS